MNLYFIIIYMSHTITPEQQLEMQDKANLAMKLAKATTSYPELKTLKIPDDAKVARATVLARLEEIQSK